MNVINGFSKKTKQQKRQWLIEQLRESGEKENINFDTFNSSNLEHQELLDEFSENTIANFALPFSLAPNFLINEASYTIPMVCEESSVVAAASHSAKYWLSRGGFKSEVLANIKVGHIHFLSSLAKNELEEILSLHMQSWRSELLQYESSMIERGGGIVSLNLQDLTHAKENYYTIELKANTCDAMGANFLNTLLEEAGKLLAATHPEISILMCILSNYTPESLVKCQVSCPVKELEGGSAFAHKFVEALEVANINPQRAVTHNKGIMNGVDAVVLATGNDFRAVEACAHAYASRSGQYRSLSRAWIKDEQFHFELEIPLALGTVGGITSLHPMAKLSLQILKQPNAKQLMQIIAATGLAQNFGAVKSLITSGIQQGHMKMHLLNILKSLEASEIEQEQCKKFFSDKVISVKSVKEHLLNLRTLH